jgi:hypothetical protein
MDQEVSMPVSPLPGRPSVEQLRKRARELHRAVRAGLPAALELVAEHARPSASARSFTLADAQHVLARSHGHPSWAHLRRHVESLPTAATPVRPGARGGVLTVDNRYRVRRGWVSEDDLARCTAVATAAHPDPSGWRPLFTARHNGVGVVVFATASGPVFAELTPTTITLSNPAGDEHGPALTFHTALGTLAGSAPACTAGVMLERPADRAARAPAVVAERVFAVPNAFPIDETGLVLRLDGIDKGLLLHPDALPGRAGGVVDRPAPRADRSTPAGRRLAAVLADAGTPPVVDADQWVPGAEADLPSGESILLGSYRGLLMWHVGRDGTGTTHVFDFGPRRGPVRDFAVVGKAVALTRVYYGIADGSGDRVVLAGVVDRSRVASVALRRADGSELPATLAGDTLLITAPGLTAPRERGRVTDRVVVRDAAGSVVEDLPYQEAD